MTNLKDIRDGERTLLGILCNNDQLFADLGRTDNRELVKSYHKYFHKLEEYGNDET